MTTTGDMAGQRPLSLTLIAAVTQANGLGVNGTLPWKLPKEMAHFRKATSAVGASRPDVGAMNAVVMGRKTWESIPTKFRPLKGRINVVVSRTPSSDAEERLGINAAEHSYLVDSLQSAVDLLRTSCPQLARTFLIGGAQLYTQAMQAAPKGAVLDRLLITRIHQPSFGECDVFLPEFRKDCQTGHEGSTADEWRQSSGLDLDAFVGDEVDKGVVEEKGVQYELQMWERTTS